MTERSTADWALLALVPALLSSNLIFGRGLAGDTGPFVVAWLRWGGTTLLLAPVLWRDRALCLALMRGHLGLWLLAGALGMVICGGGVYWSLARTTATNATLIYATSPLFILLLQRLGGRRIAAREYLGIVLAFLGIGVIALRGDWARAATLSLNAGDLGILVASVAWAGYTLLLRRPAFAALPPLTALGAMSLSGLILLTPPALAEALAGPVLPQGPRAWLAVAGLVVVSSLAAFWGLQRVVRRLGASVAGLAMYLMPPYSAALAALFLGERLEIYHFVGIVSVLAGLVIATLRMPAPARAPAR